MMHRIGDLRAESYPYLGLGQNQILVVGATGEWGGGCYNIINDLGAELFYPDLRTEKPF